MALALLAMRSTLADTGYDELGLKAVAVRAGVAERMDTPPSTDLVWI
ncbi:MULTISPECIES: hypothetical protein [Cupriavidus]